MKQLLHNRHLQICAALLAADCLVFTVVNPRTASAVWLITGYSLLGLTLLAATNAVIGSFKADRQFQQALRRFLRYGSAAAVALIGLQSVGQLTSRDIIALSLFTVIAYLYFGYNRKLAAEAS